MWTYIVKKIGNYSILYKYEGIVRIKFLQLFYLNCVLTQMFVKFMDTGKKLSVILFYRIQECIIKVNLCKKQNQISIFIHKKPSLVARYA